MDDHQLFDFQLDTGTLNIDQRGRFGRDMDVVAYRASCR
jgi:hypothetical protein